MVKKQLANGDPCEKCAKTEEMLKRRGLWQRIDEVVWAIEGDPSSPGAKIAARHEVKLAPFFMVQADDGSETVVTSALRLVRQHLENADAVAPPETHSAFDLESAGRKLENAKPLEVLRFALEHFGERCAIGFSGAEDVVLIDMATSLGLPFSVFTLDTGRLHNETYEFIDDVRRRYGVEIRTLFPDATAVTELVNTKGPNSFYRDGHLECCEIRRLQPLRTVLSGFEAWITGQRRDGQAGTALPVVQADPVFSGLADPLVRFNPLAAWVHVDVFDYVRRHGVATNPLHDRGFATIGCAPCTRSRSEHLDEPDRWWWEDSESDPPVSPDPGAGI
jgi:phosphoadenosine phosphosulfate reductase